DLLNKPELTAQQFPENHLSPNNQSSPNNQYPITNNYLYKTGDLGKWLSDGNVVFLGRIDQQVKIRGFRIELEGIGARLLEYEGVKEAVVTVRTDETGDKYLCAYIVTGVEVEMKEGGRQIKDYLARRLPEYMVPLYIIRIEQLPLTPNGKVDKRALPEPAAAHDKHTYEAPEGETEIKLAEMWAGVLGHTTTGKTEHRPIGRNDDFFRIGGHSLKATILSTKIHRLFNVRVPLTEIFKMSTLNAMARYIMEAGTETYNTLAPAEKKNYYPLSAAQKRIYILQLIGGGVTAYNIPVISVLEGEVNPRRLEEVFAKLVHRHESLRTSFLLQNDNPYQCIHEKVEFKIEYPEMEGEGNRERGENECAHLIRTFIRPFDLAQPSLIRVALVRMEGDAITSGDTDTIRGRYLLMVDIHH
ncbi:MAG: AMP-binding protein, partial [bacterium]|nr:AMP-binding protein [bacterium]